MGLFDFKKNKKEELERDESSNVQNSWLAAIDHSKRVTMNNRIGLLIILGLTLKIWITEPIVIVEPPNISESISMIGKKASASYKKQWGIFISDLLGNVNVRNADLVLEILKPMVSIQDYEKLNAQVTAHVKALDIRNQVQDFTTLDVFYDNKYDRVIVYGERRFTDRKKRSNQEEQRRPVRWTYELQVSNANGSPKLNSITQYEGAPHIERNRMAKKRDK